MSRSKLIAYLSTGLTVALGFTCWGAYQEDQKKQATINQLQKQLASLRHQPNGNDHSKTFDVDPPSYLHPKATMDLGCTNCPYTNPTYPSIGADQSFICPKNQPFYLGTQWYISRDILPFINNDYDKKRIDIFLKNMDTIKDIINKYCVKNIPINNHNDMDITLKDNNRLHLTYQYINCQTQENIQKIIQNFKQIFDNKKYIDIFKEFGYNSWNDIEIGFDKILCMNDHYNGDVTFDLFLDNKSQYLMKKLIDRTEEIEQHEFGIKLSLKRNLHQQAFHFTIGTITFDKTDYKQFDSKELMDLINAEMDGQFGTIKLFNIPALDEKMTCNTLTLGDKYKFKKKKFDAFDAHVDCYN